MDTSYPGLTLTEIELGEQLCVDAERRNYLEPQCLRPSR